MREAFALHQAERLPQAESLYRRILELHPDNHDALYLLGLVEHARGNAGRAVDLVASAIRLHGGDPAFHRSFGDILYQLERWSEAAGHYEAALALDPAQPVTLLANLAAIYRSQSRIDASIARFREALASAPSEADIFSSYLFTLNFSTSISPGEIFAEHRRYGEQFGAPAQRTVNAEPARRIRLGYVSPDFNHHAVACFIEPVLAQHDPARFEVFCYYLQARKDEDTARLKALSAHWIECASLSVEQLAARIEADRIDILVDLAGHTANNRLPVFARKPAPVQVTWLGYLNTSGLDAMDYRLTDHYADPPGVADRHHTETLVRLPDSQWCYRHPGATPPVSELPALATGTLCFGSFNKYQKLSVLLLDLWAKLLLQSAGARMLFVGVPQDEQPRLAEFFAERGVAVERLEMHGRVPLAEFRELHRRVDIALDSHPYSGATTTCDSLWMGVPTLTLTGATSISRSSASLLHTVGLDQWIARTAKEFVQLARHNAADLRRLAELRAGLRERIKASPLMDAARFTRNIESSYQTMWQAHCSRLRPGG